MILTKKEIEMINLDIETILKKSSLEEIKEFYYKQDNEGLFYYLENFSCEMTEKTLFKKYKAQPFYIANVFFYGLVDKCFNIVIEEI